MKLRKLDDETATDSTESNNPDNTIPEDNSKDSENTDNKTPDENSEESDIAFPEDTAPPEEDGADNKKNPEIPPAPVVIPFTGTMTTCLECATDPTKKFC